MQVVVFYALRENIQMKKETNWHRLESLNLAVVNLVMQTKNNQNQEWILVYYVTNQSGPAQVQHFVKNV